MIKKIIPLVIATLFLLSLLTIKAEAGTLVVGGKLWYAFWDSAVGEPMARGTNNNIDQWYNSLGYTTKTTSDIDTGKGYLAGPMVSYMTDDKLWTFSFAYMFINSFSQKSDATVKNQNPPYDTLSGEYELELMRTEIDLAVIRRVTNIFKIFFGYKQQDLKETFIGKVDGDEHKLFEVDATVKMPTFGIGLTLPISASIFFSLQLGVLYVMPDVTITDYWWDEKVSPGFDDSFGFNGEAALSFLIGNDIIIQAGYRYQRIQFKSDDTYFKEVNGFDEWDVFHGATVAAVYMIPMNGQQKKGDSLTLK